MDLEMHLIKDAVEVPLTRKNSWEEEKEIKRLHELHKYFPEARRIRMPTFRHVVLCNIAFFAI
jgi:hypothetical protein